MMNNPEVKIDDFIKAVRCLSTQSNDGSCYEDDYNSKNAYKQSISCFGDLFGTVKCPYNQSSLDVCFKDGDCSEWLEDIAELLAELQVYRQIGTLEEVRNAVNRQDNDIQGEKNERRLEN